MLLAIAPSCEFTEKDEAIKLVNRSQAEEISDRANLHTVCEDLTHQEAEVIVEAFPGDLEWRPHTRLVGHAPWTPPLFFAMHELESRYERNPHVHILILGDIEIIVPCAHTA